MDMCWVEELITERYQSKVTREFLTDKAKIKRYNWSDSRNISIYTGPYSDWG
jgi:ribosomal protein S17E